MMNVNRKNDSMKKILVVGSLNWYGDYWLYWE